MPSETEIIIAFLFKRSGKSRISFSETYLTLSMDLNWFTPEDAKVFINGALKQKLLTKKGELIEPNFDYDKLTVPVGFTPSKRVFEEKEIEKHVVEPENILNKIVRQIVEKTKQNNEEILKKIKEVEKEKNITSEVAALLVGKEHGVYLEEFFKEIENKIFLG